MWLNICIMHILIVELLFSGNGGANDDDTDTLI